MRARVVGVMWAVGCAQGDLPPGFGDGLARTRACGDAVMVAADSADRVALIVEVDGVVAAAHDAQQVLAFGWEVADHPDSVRVVVADHASHLGCAGGEVLTDPEQVFRATAGRVALNVTARGASDEVPLRAHLEVEVFGLDLIDADGGRGSIGTQSWRMEIEP